MLLAGQTADPVALRAVARLLGADEDFYSKTALRYLHRGSKVRVFVSLGATHRWWLVLMV